MIVKNNVVLRISSSLMSPTDISTTLGIPADRSIQKGDLISERSPKPTFHKKSIWFKKSDLPEEHSLTDHILALTQVLHSCYNGFIELQGCDADLVCGVFSDNTQINFYLEDRALQAVAPYKIDLLISGYTDYA